MMNGLPATLAASVTVAGPGFSQTIPVAGTGTRTLPNLTPGTYTVSGTGTAGYSTSSQTIAVVAGQSPTVTLVFTAVPQPPRWPLWLMVVIVGLAGVLLAAALSSRRRRGVAAASVMQFRAHDDPGTQRIYVDSRPIEAGVTQLTVPEERAAPLHEPASAAEPPRDPFGRTDVPDHA